MPNQVSDNNVTPGSKRRIKGTLKSLTDRKDNSQRQVRYNLTSWLQIEVVAKLQQANLQKQVRVN